MNSLESRVAESGLMRTCIHMLDTIYSSQDCMECIEPLASIESRVHNSLYSTLTSFKEDLQQTIPIISMKSMESLSNEKKLPEEYATTPIYSSIQLKNESKMYSVHINKHIHLHQSIIAKSTNSFHRLYIADRRDVLLEAKDSVDSILTLFFDVNLSSLTESTTRINAITAIVHPLGDYHPMTTSDKFDGWIKVKVVQIHTIHAVIPAKLGRDLFQMQEQVPHKVRFSKNTTESAVEYNALVQQFMSTIVYPQKNNGVPKSTQAYTPNQGSISKYIVKKPTSPAHTTVQPSATPAGLVHPWKRLEKYCLDTHVTMSHKRIFETAFKRSIDASGYFKYVYFTEKTVLQIFQRSTASQRIVEVASLLALRDKPCIGRINDIVHDGNEVVGLTMDRYDMTLKDYLQQHTHHRLTAQQRMDIILQMLYSIHASHEAGIAHRDLSTVNFMMNRNGELYLIDFGKAVFFFVRDAKRWWVEPQLGDDYKDDVRPATREELAVWCRNLPFVMARPDHGYRTYRSIQTLPKSQRDHELLTYLIDPAAEDIYSLGAIIWKIFSGMEPWPGVFDTEVKKLREIVGTDASIQRTLERSMPGPTSHTFMDMFLRADPEDRKTAGEILQWLEQKEVQEKLLEEWEMSTGTRRTAARNNIHCKAVKVEEEEKPTIPLDRSVPVKRSVGRPKGSTKKEPVVRKTNRVYKRTGVPLGRPRLKDTEKAYRSLGVARKPLPYTYVPTGRPRGRPRKNPLPVAMDTNTPSTSQETSPPNTFDAPKSLIIIKPFNEPSEVPHLRPTEIKIPSILPKTPVDLHHVTPHTISKDAGSSLRDDTPLTHNTHYKLSSLIIKPPPPPSTLKKKNKRPASEPLELNVIKKPFKKENSTGLYIQLPSPSAAPIQSEEFVSQLSEPVPVHNDAKVNHATTKEVPYPLSPTWSSQSASFLQSPALSNISNPEIMEEVVSPTSPTSNKKKDRENDKETGERDSQRPYVSPPTEDTTEDYGLALYAVLKELGVVEKADQ